MLDRFGLEEKLGELLGSEHDNEQAKVILADAIEAYVKSATVNTTVTGTSASGGPVTGVGTGTLS